MIRIAAQKHEHEGIGYLWAFLNKSHHKAFWDVHGCYYVSSPWDGLGGLFPKNMKQRWIDQ